MTDLVLEFYSTEMPAKMQMRACDDLKRLLEEAFGDLLLPYENIETYVSPCHLTAYVKGLPLSQEDRVEEKKGPRVDAPEAAIAGFLKGQGVERQDCVENETPKGTFLFVEVHHKGKPVAELLPTLVDGIIDAFPWPKSMTWGCGTRKWVRPLKSGLCVFDGKAVQFDIRMGAAQDAPVISFGNMTKGHRVLAPDAFVVEGFEQYQKTLRERFVIIDHRVRKAEIEKQINAVATSKGLTVVADDQLLDEVTGLVEWPVALIGAIDEAYMSLPPEVLMTSMKVHQRYFALSQSDGKLAPYFVVVANLPTSDDGQTIVTGNENVLKARLSDARFFYEQDSKQSLAEHGQKLDRLIFHTQLGSIAEKTERVVTLAQSIAEMVGESVEEVQQAARLIKCDLVTEMVGEFPELQGVMGKYYAQNEGLGERVSTAIEEHYWPKGADDQCPQSAIGKILALADRLDTLVGFFAIGIQPTGSKDPFALRRSALGIIRILEEEFMLSLKDVFNIGYQNYAGIFKHLQTALSSEETNQNLHTFFQDRLKVFWKDRGMRYDYIAASFAVGIDDPLCVLKKRVLALNEFMNRQDMAGANLLAGYKRAVNIVRIEEKKDNVSYDQPVDPGRFMVKEEETLYTVLKETTSEVNQRLEGFDFTKAMQEIASLRGAVDDYFEKVIVNHETQEIRKNRLNLLSSFRKTMEQVADFSCIEG